MNNSHYNITVLAIARCLHVNLDRRTIKWKQYGDEVFNVNEEADNQTASPVKIPSKLKAVIKFGYDEGIRSRLALQNLNFKSWIKGVLTHTQAHFRHPSLGTTIEFEVCLV